MPNNPKIKDIHELAEQLAAIRNGGETKTVVQCHGIFDLLHIGHIRHFEEAKKQGDVLVVTITPDRYVNKGLHRPAFGEELRAEAIAALECVDYVAVNKWPTAVETVELLRPDVYAKGADYRDSQADITGKIVDEEVAVQSVGGRVIFTDDVVFSSSNLINKYLPVFPAEVRDYLAGFSQRHSSGEVLGYLKNARSLRVLLVGEAIIDEYQYCEQIGKSAKEPILAVRYVSSEQFAGGILAVANHVANFCDIVGMVTMLGDQTPQPDIIRQGVMSSVDQMVLHKANSPTIVKRRFVENYLLQKMFEVYEMNDDELDQSQSRDLCRIIEDALPRYDIVIVADYGHGMLTEEVRDLLCRKAPFLAVNTQANAANRGFNTISRYSRADFICLAEPEIALEERNHRRDLRDMVLQVSQKLNCGRIIITRGKRGNLCYGEDEGFFDIPAFADQVVDRMGAGDAVLSLSALCMAQGAPVEVAGFIGNIVGAQAVATLGHSSSIEPVALIRHIESVLK